jgi:glycosyltransferase involved in cell wall biosynthesis
MYRALATTNGFASRGWRVTVLTATHETFETLTGTDPGAEERIDPRISVVRVPFDLTRGETDLARWSRTRVVSPLWWGFLRARRERRSFPESIYGGWLPALLEAAERIHRSDPVSLVIGSANPNVDFAPGDHLHRRFGVPYVMDYRDSWHLDYYTGRRRGNPRSRSARLERRLLRNAHEVWFVNQPILDWHARHYPAGAENYFVVANGFDPEFLDSTPRERGVRGHGLVFGYLGTIYGPMPLRESLEGWRLARERSPLLADSSLVIRGRLGHFSAEDPALLGLIDEFGSVGVSYRGPVGKSDVAEVYRGFDALLLILGKSRYVTSGKVFEYAATGLPIASLHDPETASSDVLAEYPAWFPTAEVTPESIARTLIETAEYAASLSPADVSANRAWARHLSREAQLGPRIAALSAAAGLDPGGDE